MQAFVKQAQLTLVLDKYSTGKNGPILWNGLVTEIVMTDVGMVSSSHLKPLQSHSSTTLLHGRQDTTVTHYWKVTRRDGAGSSAC